MKLTHPESKQEIEVADDQVDPYLSQGWHAKGKKPADSE